MVLTLCGLGEWSHFPFGGMVRPAKEHPNMGILSKGMFGMGKTVERTLPVEESEPQIDLQLVSHEAQAQA